MPRQAYLTRSQPRGKTQREVGFWSMNDDDDVQYDDPSEHAPPPDEAEIALDNERAAKALRVKQRFQVAAIDLVDTQPSSAAQQPAVPVTPVVSRAVADLAYDYAGTWAPLAYVRFERRSIHVK